MSCRSQAALGEPVVRGQLHLGQLPGDLHVAGVHHARHAVAHRLQVLELTADEHAGIEVGGVARREPSGDPELGMGLQHVVLLDKGLLGELPVDREAAGVPPLGAQRVHHPPVEDVGDGLQARSERGRVVVEVDPCATTPGLAAHRRQVEVGRVEVLGGERPGLGHFRVVPVRPVAPAVEGADEAAAARAPSLHELDTAVAADVVEGPHTLVGSPQDDHRLIEDLVLRAVADFGNLLEAAGHLPDAGPDELGFHGVEVRVVVALLANPVHHFHGIGHREGGPLVLHDRHLARPSGVRRLALD